MTLAAYVYWASFVDVLEAAYPYRSVDLGWAATATLWGAALQLAAAGLALVALCVFAAVRWRPDDGDAGDAAAFSAAATYDDVPYAARPKPSHVPADDAPFAARPAGRYEMASVPPKEAEGALATAEVVGVVGPGAAAPLVGTVVGTVVASSTAPEGERL